MEKTLFIDMDYFCIEGDVLDVTKERASVIYSLSKEVMDEICVDYVDDDNKDVLNRRRYDLCTFFFNLNDIWSNRKRDSIIKEICKYLKESGKIYLWDINKERGEIIDKKIKIKMPDSSFKETDLLNLNPLIQCSYKDLEKVISKYFIIEEEKIWEDMFYIKGTKKKKI